MNKARHVLLIEDNPGDVRLMHEMVKEMSGDEPWTVRVESTLATGITAAETNIFEIVLLDLTLPDGSALDTLVGFRAKIEHTPVIVLTGSHDQSLGIQAVQSGAQDYLIKGDIDPNLLLRSIVYAIERHHNNEALRRSEEAYRSLIDDVFDSSTISIFILNADFRIVWMNEATEVYFGVNRQDILGQDKRVLARETLECIFEEPDVYTENILHVYETDDYTSRFECHVLKDGNRAERWLEHWSQPIRSGIFAGGRIENYADISLHKHAKETLREVATFDERQRIARDLHDSVTQSIFSASLMAESALKQWVINPKKAKGLIEQVHQLTSASLSELRVLLLELRPQSMTQVKLTQLAKLLVDTMRSRRNMDIRMDLDEFPPLPENIHIAFYRMMQEMFNNTVKHSHASQMMLKLKMVDGGIRLSLEDNGEGFDVDSVAASSMGIAIMRERAAEIKAVLDVQSIVGKGTRINLFWTPVGDKRSDD